jgi:hypothetical protein
VSVPSQSGPLRSKKSSPNSSFASLDSMAQAVSKLASSFGDGGRDTPSTPARRIKAIRAVCEDAIFDTPTKRKQIAFIQYLQKNVEAVDTYTVLLDKPELRQGWVDSELQQATRTEENFFL